MYELDAAARSAQPYSNIGLIVAHWPDGTQSIGTFSLVGRNDILTAGHLVHAPRAGGWAAGFEFYFGADYNSVTGRFESWIAEAHYAESNVVAWPDAIYTDGNDRTMLQSEARYDVALIGIDVPIGDSLGWLGLDPGHDAQQTAVAVGYPSGTTGMMQDRVSVRLNRDYGLYESASGSLGAGSSGGPLLVEDRVVGVKSTTHWWVDIGSRAIYDQVVRAMSDNDHLIVSGDPYSGAGGRGASIAATEAFLQQRFGLSLGEAHDWLMGKLDAPREIYEVCSAHDVTSAMLADIVQPSFEQTVSAEIVEAWLAAQGLPSLAHEQATKAFVQQQFGLTLADARAWVMARLDAPGEIHDVCVTNDVSSAMLADIVQAAFPAVTLTGVAVNEWLSAQGLPSLA